jgi:glycosyltransferase involved in cell wall biosynthesis
MAPRILVLVTSTDRRGAEIDGMRLTHELVDRGLGAEVVALAPGSSSTPLDLPVLADRARSVASLRALRRRAAQVDLVIAHGSSTLPVAAIALAGTGVPFVYRSIGDPAHWARGRLHRMRTGTLLRRAAHVVALWTGAADSLASLYGVPSDRLTVIPIARDARPPVEPAEVAQARGRLGLPTTRIAVAVVAALSHEKRIDRAVSAVGSDGEMTLVVAGDGPLAALLHELPGADSVRFLGALDDVRAVYAAADVVLLTSETEGMPGALIEADLAGCPIVSTSVGAVPWMVENGLRAVLVPAEPTSTEIVEAIRRAASMPRLDAVAGRPWEWSTVGPRWIDLVERVVAASPRARS